MLKGSLVAIVTPMQAGGALDLRGLAKLVDFHVANGTSGIVVVGTTGESPTVSVEEHCLLIKSAVESAAGRVPVIAGTGANATAEAIALTGYAKEVGASCCLSVVPYYNKPSQEGLYRHFRSIVETVDLPLILYNVPSRSVADLANDTVLRLAQVPGIIGIKDATADLGRGSELIRELRAAGHTEFAVYSGDDMSALPVMLMGGQGVISVTANVAPRLLAELCAAALAGDVAGARSVNDRLLPLHRKLFLEANPIPVKWALAEMGLIGGDLRLPLTPLAPAHHESLRAALREAGCL
ncbi:MAG TPA: 4-hydroxy-tetrahydrodipicolinate synthase [Casimicrobiaceae bacterium]|jgi:4-hydroxy-tetrahydrodipicolinate synthase|nr:4-hydroxy-tetrahydrodipicolinate synthase [Casimicrobiaceae bacterium]